MMDKRHHISSGIYVVIDPSMEPAVLYDKLDSVLKERVAAVQIWDNFDENEDVMTLIVALCRRCHDKGVPILINNRWQYLRETPLDGVHFDTIPTDYEGIREGIDRPFLCGITCTNGMEPILWAKDNGLDYISFCSMFPSNTAASCELVSHDTVRKARRLYDGPIFLAGGIKPHNMGQLQDLPYTGLAVISGVMNSEAPDQSIREYLKNER